MSSGESILEKTVKKRCFPLAIHRFTPYYKVMKATINAIVAIILTLLAVGMAWDILILALLGR
jgi:hypothetical protein